MPSFQAGGLASGLDTNSIVEQLTQLERRPLNIMQQRATEMRSQVSALGELAGRMSSLKTAIGNLGSTGVLGFKTTSVHSAFSSTISSGALPGRYAVQVTQLAQAAKARTQAFTDSAAPVTGGSLDITVNGTTTSITMTDGMTLADVGGAINASGAGVTAVLLNDGTSSYLSITNKDTGHTIGQPASSALSIVETSTGVLGQPLTAAITTQASNAKVTVDGLSFERTSNQVADAVPGATLNVASLMGASEDLVVVSDSGSTQANIQKFVDAYNLVAYGLKQHLAASESTKRASTLAGDGTLRSLQRSLQGLLSTEVPGLSGVRTLADIGIKTEQDGSLTINSATLNTALTRDSGAVNALFTTASTGMSAKFGTLVDAYVNSTDGALTLRQQGLNSSIKRVDESVIKLELRIEAFRDNLIRQFTAMETTVASLRSIGNFLDQQEAALGKK